jgi:hypothetical protein
MITGGILTCIPIRMCTRFGGRPGCIMGGDILGMWLLVLRGGIRRGVRRGRVVGGLRLGLVGGRG